MKKIGAVLLSLLLLLSYSVNAIAAQGIIKNGRTLVPVRGVFEQLGFSVNWDQSTEKATLSDGKHDVSIIKGESYFKADGKQIYPDVPQQVINNSLYLPVKAIADAIGADTSWNADSKLVHINYNGKDAYITCVTETVQNAPAKSAQSVPAKQTQQSKSISTSPSGRTYIINTNTKKIHEPGCSSVPEISPKNKQEYTGSINDLTSNGYSPCKRCNPK